MKLYNKIQELINESESLKQKNNEVLGLAKNEFKGYLAGKLIEIPIIVKENVKELVDKEALTKEIHNELLSQFDTQAISNGLKQEVKSEIESELQQAKTEINKPNHERTISVLTSKILWILESQLNAITESVIKNLDFSFLQAQPKAFKKYIFKVI